jgi:hypothetical protein
VASTFRNIAALAAGQLGALLVVGVALAQQAGPPEDFEQRHSALRKRGDLQWELTPPPIEEPPERNTPSWFDVMLDALGPLFQAIFWVALVLGALALIAFVTREVWAGRAGANPKKDATAEQATDFRPEEARARALLAEADRLAALGRFEEAVRTLLHRSIEDIEERAPNTVKKAQTSREIAGMPILPEAVRGAFAPITRAVEEAWFGGRQIDAARYQACRKAYSDFALPASWAASGAGARA